MKIDKLRISEVTDKVRKLLESDENISPTLKAMVEMLLTVVTLLVSRLQLSSRNSNLPPSMDQNRPKKKKKENKKRNPGGQPGRVGKNLQKIVDPDSVVSITIDKRTLPQENYREVGFEIRQVVDIEISRVVTEYQAQILEDTKGNRYTAEFPKGVTRPIQYGQSVKSHAVYLSQFQLIPYERVTDYFVHEANIPISPGSLFNFNQEAYERLEEFEAMAKVHLMTASVLHADETGINISGNKAWLHNASDKKWAYFFPHLKRGSEAMNDIGILPNFSGVIVHDHWNAYYTYRQCTHALCNAHHLRELQWVIDNVCYRWAEDMKKLLLDMNDAVTASATQSLEEETIQMYQSRYREILKEGIEEMPPSPPQKIPEDGKKKRGRQKKPKELNFLERLQNFEEDVLRFMKVSNVPFTNNQGENDIRMTKVQQKISGCFRTMDGAKIFCRIRSYLLTSQKHGVTPCDALRSLFHGKLPDVLYEK